MLRIASVAFPIVAWAGLAGAAEENRSVYTEIDRETDCTVYAAATDGEGDWSNLVCTGYRGYPVIIHTGDLRESISYGFPAAQDDDVWESFVSFNEAGPRIEWRLAVTAGREIPFATIHRWFVSDVDFPDDKIEVLVVEKIRQPYEGQGCAVAYVVATGNPDANRKAQQIADRTARDFECGADQPAIDAGTTPVPPFSRSGG